MSKLARDIRSKVRSGASIPATVIDTRFGKASVRILENGSILRGLDVIGGPVAVDQKVRVDFTTAKPTIIATGAVPSVSTAPTAGGLSFMGAMAGAGGEIKIIRFSGGVSAAMYDPSAAGLASALAACNPKDIVFVPDIDVTGDFSMVDGCDLVGVSCKQSIIEGTLTMGAGCLVENMQIFKNENSADKIIAVNAQSGVESVIRDSEIHCYQCGSGGAVGVELMADTEMLEVRSTVVIGCSKGTPAQGFAFSGPSGGSCRIFHSYVYSSSGDDYHDE